MIAGPTAGGMTHPQCLVSPLGAPALRAERSSPSPRSRDVLDRLLRWSPSALPTRSTIQIASPSRPQHRLGSVPHRRGATHGGLAAGTRLGRRPVGDRLLASAPRCRRRPYCGRWCVTAGRRHRGARRRPASLSSRCGCSPFLGTRNRRAGSPPTGCSCSQRRPAVPSLVAVRRGTGAGCEQVRPLWIATEAITAGGVGRARLAGWARAAGAARSLRHWARLAAAPDGGLRRAEAWSLPIPAPRTGWAAACNCGGRDHAVTAALTGLWLSIRASGSSTTSSDSAALVDTDDAWPRSSGPQRPRSTTPAQPCSAWSAPPSCSPCPTARRRRPALLRCSPRSSTGCRACSRSTEGRTDRRVRCR